ncbi:hypothetical protein HRG_009274 [Hirsutella rhossiliensis]|uniref:Uncharacterized protein n=1 Tax=Hirsutella rhossiliensis TaxID=111463 RepID=A0A9P8MQC1_9HYPO|nr:uncharacterized protein HRG_09274 [Hirsutella rhossiliensis]KAH0959492.1 hypothetical protein HRG_09274 [Hirsutella rhossiliensis]
MAESSLFAAFGAVLGYIGSEVATKRCLEQLLWPQRHYSNFTLGSFLMLAFFMPMGGPLFKPALEALDTIFSHGLFRGSSQGHMLGTVFFPQLSWSYTMHEHGDQSQSRTGNIRNCLWVRTLAYINIPRLHCCSQSASSDDLEKGRVCHDLASPPVRARTAFSHLTLARPTTKEMSSLDIPFVKEDPGRPGPRVFLAICAAETSAILCAVGVSVAFRSPWCVLWLAPLILRLTSALFALHREPLISTSSSTGDDPARDFEIHCPQAEGSFMIITGPPALVLQFVRHYGHPIRSRTREAFQYFAIVVFACQFPFGLFCSVVWMPIKVQYVWVSYQLYVVLAAHVVRYSSLGRSTTTEAKLTQCLGQATAALFGHKRGSSNTIKASVVATYHDRYSLGRAAADQLLRRHELRQDQAINTPEALSIDDLNQ